MPPISDIPSLNDAHDIATERQRIDAEIAQLESRILTLKASRNTLTAIARLLPEITQEIFVLASRSSGFREIGKTSLLISWVCHGWRTLAHQTSELWSYVDFNNVTWMETALSRTQNRHLSFSLFILPQYSGDPSKLASLCLGNLTRTVILELKPTGYNFAPPPSFWTTPVPYLVRLSLESLSLPTNLFSGVLPALQRLSLHSCELDWDDLPLPPGLKSLSITNSVSKVSASTLSQKLRIIGTGLESITIRDSLLSTVDTLVSRSSHTRQELLNLDTLIINEQHALPVAFILNQLSLPSRLAMTNIVVHGNVDQFDVARAFVASRGMTKWPVKELDVNVQEEAIEIVATEQSPSANLGIDEDGEIDETRQVNYVSFRHDVFQDVPDFDSFFDIFPFPPIRKLDLSGGHFARYGPEVVNYFHEKGDVRHLDVSIFYIPTFTSVIYDQTEFFRQFTGYDIDAEVGSLEGGGGGLDNKSKEGCVDCSSFKNLITLDIYGDNDEEYHFARDYYEVLREWLLWRRLMGIGVKTLVFRDMNIPPKDYLKALYEGVVDQFECVSVREMEDESNALPFDP
ncbi:hypothetical protein BDN72DRAFT_960956 [Pluteus cervinus]|uniref:Uncharacterized protein n=1 Tax=Pluteus cervinus TaxID=181527 RepID=A0ACD3APB5_9AGAR|nr:hypothetical protein BDN72DRAFT_960956 [Pluteus cervinus]